MKSLSAGPGPRLPGVKGGSVFRHLRCTRIYLKFNVNFLESKTFTAISSFMIFILFSPVELSPGVLTISRVTPCIMYMCMCFDYDNSYTFLKYNFIIRIKAIAHFDDVRRSESKKLIIN